VDAGGCFCSWSALVRSQEAVGVIGDSIAKPIRFADPFKLIATLDQRPGRLRPGFRRLQQDADAAGRRDAFAAVSSSGRTNPFICLI
jgi:hypothetical protein